jgi:tetratricopeptide (TPR) repeat protein
MYREAVRLHDQITRSDHEHREALASILGDWARYLHYVEDFEGAKALRDRAIALRTQLVEDHPLVPSYRLHMAILHQNIGYVLAMKRRFEESRQSQRQALDLLEELVQDYPDVPRYREVLANTWNMYAYPLSQTDGNEAAQAAWETARRQYLELLEQQPDDPGSHSDLAAILDNLASLHYRNEDYIQCVALAREAIDHEELARKNDMANALYIRQLEAHYRILALGLNRLGDRDGAIEAYELCVNLMSQLVEQDPERVSYISALGGIYNNMAIVALDSADYPRAESFVRKAIEHQEDARSKNPKDTQVLMYLRNHQLQLARILRDTDHPREAVEAYSKAVAFAEQAVTESDDASLRKASVSVVCELSRFLADPRSGQALDLSRSAELVEKAFEANPEVRVIQYTRGFVAIHKSDWDQAIEQLPGLVGDDQLDLDFQGFAAVYAAMAYAKKGDVERANDYLRKAKEITEQVEPAERRDELKTVRQNVEMLLQAKTQSESPDKKEVSLSSDSRLAFPIDYIRDPSYLESDVPLA